ncbi:MAG: thioredoxin-disulfide reductase [Dehalococcoidia bacterium]|nr:thioredoxin-disulfide reductase [Dehalococcoidia bacterium]MDH4291523.1 thioredoxin-disulfide reductase [Dehalococcoidia bacterium]
MKRSNSSRSYQVVIIGGGPAGLTAGLYCARSKFNSLLIEQGIIGGQITNAERVDNYPGFPKGISGIELGQLIHEQATSYGLETLLADVTKVMPDRKHNLVNSSEGDFMSESIIIASGSQFRKLGVPGEDQFVGKGVSYCATCDGPLFKGKTVAVVGGGDSAVTEALYLSKFASSVKVIHRRNQLRASKIFQERATAEPKIEFTWDTVVTQIEGDGVVKQLTLKNTRNDKISILELAGVFVAIGSKPNTAQWRGLLPLDEEGYIITNELMETKIPGIYAAGDVRHNSAKQAITAAGDGATAAISAARFLSF